MHALEGLAAGRGMGDSGFHQRLGHDGAYGLGSAALGVRRRSLAGFMWPNRGR